MSTVKLPGMIDVHTHLRDPGATQKEDFFSGTEAALISGVTLILDMPNNPIPTISLKTIKEKEKLAKRKAVCDYGFNFGAHQLDNTQEFKKVIPRVCALKIYMDHTTGTLLIEKLDLLEKIFQRWESDKPIMVHAEDATLAKAISLAYLYKRKLHVCHVSLIEEVKLIKKAKEKGLNISCEVTPHHLFLTENDAKKLGAYGKMQPALKTQRDVRALWQGIKEEVIDMIGTDHAPHTRKEKESGKPPLGVPGIETALPLLLTAVRQKRLTLEKVIELYHKNPRKIFKLKKQKDTFIEVDLNKKWVIKNENLKTRCQWSPFHNWQVYGKVEKVVLRGKPVYQNGKVRVKKGFGKNITDN